MVSDGLSGESGTTLQRIYKLSECCSLCIYFSFDAESTFFRFTLFDSRTLRNTARPIILYFEDRILAYITSGVS